MRRECCNLVLKNESKLKRKRKNIYPFIEGILKRKCINSEID